MAGTSITTCPYVITVGGISNSPEVYKLKANLSCPYEDGIDIQASYVKLDLNGYSITGSGSGYGNGHGILVYSSGDRLTGITITGPSPNLSAIQTFTYGIELDNVDDSTVENVVLSNNLYGLSTSLLNQVSNTVTRLQVLNNTATLNGQNGIALFNSTKSTVSGNLAAGNGTNPVNGGILIWAGDHNLVTLNNADGNLVDGIDIYNSTDNKVTWNSAFGNANAGILMFFDSTLNLVNHNTAKGNGKFDLGDYDVSCSTNTWSDDWFLTNNQSCVQ
jgi:parallel beta-helix repeat protein